MMTSLSAKQYKAIECLATGKTNLETAEICGVSVRTIQNWKHDDLFMDELRQAIHLEIDELAGRAKEIIADLMENAKTEGIKLKSAQDILSRAGYDATSKRAVEFEQPTEIHITIDDD